MKIRSLQISNVLSFSYHERIEDAPLIIFEEGMNILIGQNGAGKSTVLEVINFIFKRVILTRFIKNQDTYNRKATAQPNDIKNIITRHNDQSSYADFRLDANWDHQSQAQRIQVVVVLDEIDGRNMSVIREHLTQIKQIANLYSSEPLSDAIPDTTDMAVTIDVTLTRANKTFTCQFSQQQDNIAVTYLTRYNFFREIIESYNYENRDKPIPPLFESFALIGSYRNYHNFADGVSVAQQTAEQQIQNLRGSEFAKSTNGIEQAEPAVFGLVRLLVAGFHYGEYGSEKLAQEAENRANDQPFLKSINSKLELVSLKVEVRLVDKRTWQYSFAFIDTKRNKKLMDINSLSAGQKAIIHLVFEAYGRGELKGGVVVIDEPEIHLHYQFQHEYLRIIEEINKEQSCQYILVTHSESLINSNTIGRVRRFTLDKDGRSTVKSPLIDNDQKGLVKILDNTRSTYAFFAKKVVLVEGDSDRYLFKAILQELHSELAQEIAVLDIGGKGNFPRWKTFFSSFGLAVYYIGDFDNVMSLEFSDGLLIDKASVNTIEEKIKQAKLDNLSEAQKQEFAATFSELKKDPDMLTKPQRSLWKPVMDRLINFMVVPNTEKVVIVKQAHPEIETKIVEKYAEHVFLLKSGAIEEYIGGAHANLNNIAIFCANDLRAWLLKTEPKVLEIRSIIEMIVNDTP